MEKSQKEKRRKVSQPIKPRIVHMLICPYCYDGPKHEDSVGCCKESSAHFTDGVEVDGEIFTLDEYNELTAKHEGDAHYDYDQN
jgi:hypothetical protein